MDMMTPGLAGQKGLRGEILLELKKAQPVTAKEFADRFGVSANAVRRHLIELEAEGLVVHDRQQRGNGAPTYTYRLSPAGEALFPKRYEDALVRLLEHVVEREGRNAAVTVLAGQYQEFRRQLGGDLDDLTPVDRLRAVANVMRGAGFMAELDVTDDEAPKLTIHNCAIHAAASCLPEVCDSELSFLQDVIDASVHRGAHIMDGCNACQYALKADDVADGAEPTSTTA